MILNSPGTLKWMTSTAGQLHRRFYSYGKITPVITTENQVPPFQLIVAGAFDPITAFDIISIDSGVVYDVLAGAQAVGLNSIIETTGTAYTTIFYPSNAPIPGTPSEPGDYYARISGNGETYFSEVFRMCSDVSQLTKISWCHGEDFEVPGGLVRYTGDAFAFKMFLYVSTEIAKPEYKYENEVEKRDGKNFPFQQIRYKLFRCEVIWPEHILDAFSLAPLHDQIIIESPFETYQLDEMDFEPNWQEQGNLAAVTIEFRTDTVVVINGRGQIGEVCEIGPGECFEVTFSAVARILEGSAEYLSGYYFDVTNEINVPFQEGDFIIIENSITGQLNLFFFSAGPVYGSAADVPGDYIYDQNAGIYYYNNGPLITNEITNVTLAGPTVQGNAVPPGVVSLYGIQGNGSEYLMGIIDAEVFTGVGFDFDPPLCLKGVKLKAANGNCGSYFESEIYNLGPFDVHNVPNDFKNPEEAEAGGIEPGGLFALTADNTLGLPEGIVLQLPPYDGGGFTSYDAGTAAIGKKCMFALREDNIHGLPGGTLMINPSGLLPLVTYPDDASAASGGVFLLRIFAFDATAMGFPSALIKKRLT
jgi:hypothetical protein